jgi:hypothetical protein
VLAVGVVIVVRRIVWFLVSLSVSACGSREAPPVSSSTHDLSTPAPSVSSPTPPPTNDSFGPATAAPSGDGDGCSEASKLVYVVSLEGDLYSFAPADKKFTKIGALDCGPGVAPVSMAVDRNAVAWVNGRTDVSSADGRLYKVDTSTARCTETKLADKWGGMGFATKPGAPLEETLFVKSSGQLKRVDFTAETLVPIQAFPAHQADMELTGTGDGRLYGFIVSSPPALAPIDQTTAAVGDLVHLDTVPSPVPPMFAFSFWGGDFYFYTATDEFLDGSSSVSRYRPSDGSIDPTYMTDIGFHIVGAGVSTCAPTTQPK